MRDRSKIDECGKCEHRDECGGCRAIAYALTGNYMGKDTQCWL